jgi:1,4-alpha-glucan branching enzyme
MDLSCDAKEKEMISISKHDPHAVLGLHQGVDGSCVIRLWRPGAKEIFLQVKGNVVQAQRIGEDGLFEYRSSIDLSCLDYQVYHPSGLLSFDPYAFAPTFGEMDAYLFSKGRHYRLYDVLGAKLHHENGSCGVKFSVWAPNAQSVFLVGDFNHWDGRVNPLRSLGSSGVWELYVPGLSAGEKYKFEINTQQGYVRLKSDPMAFQTEYRPQTASIVCNLDEYVWNDRAWFEQQEKKTLDQPIVIYEVHLGSWKKKDGEFLNYRQIAHELSQYCIEMGFTHVELMPVAEHPLDESWGYQVTGAYAITSRYGSAQDFQYFVDHMHQKGIGVFVDWVAAHFPMDDFSLAQFDGTYLYEHDDPRKGFHPHWNTYIFNYGRNEVSNFLIANALFFFDKMHIDGLRVDAVASMLYLDYGRKEGEWIPNAFGGKENLEAIEFIKHLNSIVHEKFPYAMMFAEESTAFPGVTHNLKSSGLGFDVKWNMGWMNDTLRYFKTDPFFRCHHQNSLTFGILYAFTEKFVLVLSHDEVVHGKASLLSKMPGDEWQKFAGVRLYYSFMMCHPGKKLLFMGQEIGQWSEWFCKEEIPWHLLEYPKHKGLQKMVSELNLFYQKHDPLWRYDFDERGFQWLDFSDDKNSVISYVRKGVNSYLICVHNFTPTFFAHYFITLANIKEIREVFNTDSEEYGGSGKVNHFVTLCQNKDHENGFAFQLSPLATMIFEVKFV